jgi:ElaB/YqjD/DUF883 family membrane-anchored ribosome-binding protein
MKAIAVAALMLAMSAFAVGGLVQRPAQNDSPPPVAQPRAEQPFPGMMRGMGPGMMNGGTGQMGQMMNRHQQMMENMNKLMQSMAAIEAEKDPAAQKAKLAEHHALLEQMRSQMMQQGEKMQQMMGCTNQPAETGGIQAPATK